MIGFKFVKYRAPHFINKKYTHLVLKNHLRMCLYTHVLIIYYFRFHLRKLSIIITVVQEYVSDINLVNRIILNLAVSNHNSFLFVSMCNVQIVQQMTFQKQNIDSFYINSHSKAVKQ